MEMSRAEHARHPRGLTMVQTLSLDYTLIVVSEGSTIDSEKAKEWG
jgi:hypothetical protein